MGVLLDNQKTEIKYKSDDGLIILYEPSKDQLEEIKQIIQDNIKIKENIGYLETSVVRYLVRNLSNIGYEIDNYTDNELMTMLDNGNRNIQLMLRELTKLIQEISDDMFYENSKKLKEINSFLNIINSNKEFEAIKNKLNKFAKRNKLNITVEDIENLQQNPENIEVLIKKINNK